MGGVGVPPAENLNRYFKYSPNHQKFCRPFFSTTYELPIFYPLCFNIHARNGGCTPLAPFRMLQPHGFANHGSRFTGRLTTHRSPASPIAARPPWCHNGHRRKISSPSGETTPLSPVSKHSERTSGSARQRSPLQVVPGSTVLSKWAF
jgi:hypothetical protein